MYWDGSIIQAAMGAIAWTVTSCCTCKRDQNLVPDPLNDLLISRRKFIQASMVNLISPLHYALEGPSKLSTGSKNSLSILSHPYIGYWFRL